MTHAVVDWSRGFRPGSPGCRGPDVLRHRDSAGNTPLHYAVALIQSRPYMEVSPFRRFVPIRLLSSALPPPPTRDGSLKRKESSACIIYSVYCVFKQTNAQAVHRPHLMYCGACTQLLARHPVGVIHVAACELSQSNTQWSVSGLELFEG